MNHSKIMVAAFAAIFFLAGYSRAMADDSNKVYSVRVNPLEYNVADKKITVGDVIGTIFDVAIGTTTNKQHEKKAGSVNAAVMAALSDVRRLVPVTGDNFDYEITGEITNISTQIKTRTVENKDSKGKVTTKVINDYTATVSIILTLTDMATGAQQTKSFSSGSSTSSNITSESKAIDYAANRVSQKVTDFFNNLFPLTAKIIERGKEKKDKMQQAYIDLGEQHGLCEGMHFDVYEISYIAGRAVRNELSALKVIEVLGDNISLCKVQRNPKGIKEALDSGAEILIISSD